MQFSPMCKQHFTAYFRAFALLTALFTALLVTAGLAQAQDTGSTRETLTRLAYIQDVISSKLSERRELGEQIESANEQDKADLRRAADSLSSDIRKLRNTLENIATNGADTSLFVAQPEEPESDWREDLSLIAEPVLDSLKELTEKPRRIKEFNDQIAARESEKIVAQSALASLETLTLSTDPLAATMLSESLVELTETWNKRLENANSEIRIAQIQIASLQGNTPLPETIYTAIMRFIKGRGLTLVLAAVAAFLVWLGLRFTLKGYRRLLLNKQELRSRTRFRLAEYSVHALTFFLILIAIFAVVYVRGDVLLLGLLILLIMGLALGIRHLLPGYMREARLLLNIGPIKEGQRIIYREIPWRIESIQMYSVLRNPELQGVLNIPLSELHGYISRPYGNDSWFPTSKGDLILLDDDKLMEVVAQNPDTVELRDRGGQEKSIPSSSFYKMNLTNLSRGPGFAVRGYFGIDYQHQSICTTEIPRGLREAVREAIGQSDLAEFIKDVRVELLNAGASSIDYWIFVTMENRAAKSYERIQRMIQSACIETCTANNWSIPYPHVSVVRKSSSGAVGDNVDPPPIGFTHS